MDPNTPNPGIPQPHLDPHQSQAQSQTPDHVQSQFPGQVPGLNPNEPGPAVPSGVSSQPVSAGPVASQPQSGAPLTPPAAFQPGINASGAQGAYQHPNAAQGAFQQPAPFISEPRVQSEFEKHLSRLFDARNVRQAWHPLALRDAAVVAVTGFIAMIALAFGISLLMNLALSADSVSGEGVTSAVTIFMSSGLFGGADSSLVRAVLYPFITLLPYAFLQCAYQQLRPVFGFWPLLPRLGVPAIVIATGNTILIGNLPNGPQNVNLGAVWFGTLLMVLILGILGRNLGISEKVKENFSRLGRWVKPLKSSLDAVVTYALVYSVVLFVGLFILRLIQDPVSAWHYFALYPVYGPQETAVMFNLTHLGSMSSPLGSSSLFNSQALLSATEMSNTAVDRSDGSLPGLFPAGAFGLLAMLLAILVTGVRYGIQRGGEIRGSWRTAWQLPLAFMIAGYVFVPYVAKLSGFSSDIQVAGWSPLLLVVWGFVVFVVAKMLTYGVISSLSVKQVRRIGGKKASAYWLDAVASWTQQRHAAAQASVPQAPSGQGFPPNPA